ncbi:MAG TPA: rhodanese-related sulfurtransferase [Steroidobacteraceae bacterium]|nr:rhodanese-related sulfurtransferase [Steroidobacteraceae bacterium]
MSQTFESAQPVVAALYKFVPLPDYVSLRAPLLALCNQHSVKGTILLAEEGVNGTIAGSSAGVQAVLEFLRSDPRLADLAHKESAASKPPFERMKVRLKREIVSLGIEGINPSKQVGQYVKPEDWNRLIDDPNVVVIDVRNDYEVALGTFKRALNPRTKSFRDLPKWVRNEPALRNKPKVAMFCTGGIRCEKSTAFLRAEGFLEVYHLQGGILKYLKTVPEQESRWEGECFVFDERVTLRHGLRSSVQELCRSCCAPLTAADKASEKFVPGYSCPSCFDGKSPQKQSALRERRRQLIR